MSRPFFITDEIMVSRKRLVHKITKKHFSQSGFVKYFTITVFNDFSAPYFHREKLLLGLLYCIVDQPEKIKQIATLETAVPGIR